MGTPPHADDQPTPSVEKSHAVFHLIPSEQNTTMDTTMSPNTSAMDTTMIISSAGPDTTTTTSSFMDTTVTVVADDEEKGAMPSSSPTPKSKPVLLSHSENIVIPEDLRDVSQSQSSSPPKSPPPFPDAEKGMTMGTPGADGMSDEKQPTSPDTCVMKDSSFSSSGSILSSTQPYLDDDAGMTHMSRKKKVMKALKQRRCRWIILFILLIILVIILITVPVVVTHSNQQTAPATGSNTSQPQNSSHPHSPNGDDAFGTAVPKFNDSNPEFIPSMAPSSAMQPLIANYVLEAIQPCLSTSILSSKSNMGLWHQLVFDHLVQQITDASTIDTTTNTMVIPLSIGLAWIAERYALMMLYLSTQGPETWIHTNGWMDDHSDVCTWYGVTQCGTRVEGSCAVQTLDLTANGLTGVIPEALCCLSSSCLTSLSLSGNVGLSSNVPQCVRTQWMNLNTLNLP